MSLELQPQLNNVVKMKAPSNYRNYKIAPISSSLTQIGFNQQQLTFELAANTLINWSKLCLSFKYNSKNCAKAGYMCYIPCGFNVFVNRIECYSGGNANFRLLDLNNASHYSKMACPLNTNYLDNPTSTGVVCPSNRVVFYDYKTTPASTEAFRGNDFLLTSFEKKDGNKEVPGSTSTIMSQKNNEYGFNFSTGNSGASEISPQYINYRLGEAYPDTIFNVDSYMVLSHAVFIRFTFNPINLIVGRLGATNYENVALDNDAVLEVSNFCLNMYVEDNPEILKLTQQQNQQGTELVIPQVFNNIYNISGKGTRGAIFKIQNMTGQNDARLYKCYSMLVGTGAGKQNYIIPSSNYVSKSEPATNKGKYDYISLYLNSKNLLNLDIAARDHINHIQNLFKRSSWTDDSTIDDNGTIAHIFDCDDNQDFSYKDNILKGIPFEGSGDFSLNWQYKIVGDAANRVECSGEYENHQYVVILSKIYLKNGQISNVPF